MRYLVVKGQPRKVLRCIDCSTPDPMHDANTNRWLTGDLGAPKD
jgi:hypothetical protein